MADHHREAWRGLLQEAARLIEARRGCPTGGAAVARCVRREARAYGTVGLPDSPYVFLKAILLAEPSVPEQTVPMLDALPEDWASHYRCEDNVVKAPPPPASTLNELYQMAQTVGGERR